MKMICVNNGCMDDDNKDSVHLTIGKWYEPLNIDRYTWKTVGVKIINDLDLTYYKFVHRLLES